MLAALACLKDPEVEPFTSVQSVAIAVKAVDAEQRHVGIVYRAEAAAEVRLLELQWHFLMRSSTLDNSYLWAQLTIESELAENIARMCKILAAKYGRLTKCSVPYAPRYTGEFLFNPEGAFLTTNGHGLTCATFVLAVFASVGVPLVRLDEWKPRDDDATWHQKIVDLLKSRTPYVSSSDLQAHIRAVEAEKGCPRFRPEEVAASAISPELPVGFEFAEAAGRQIVGLLAVLPNRAPRPVAPTA